MRLPGLDMLSPIWWKTAWELYIIEIKRYLSRHGPDSISWPSLLD